ncbi:hypothetical protein AAIB33_00970 [Microbacterium sp. AZCO]|uniref:hypothetical protein n=1 Tax=Microbacterium sp. AZCO TaxID=3142976 RepID=UPI0031F386E4
MTVPSPAVDPVRPRRGVIGWMLRLTARDAVVVLIVSVAMSLSAFSVYEATQAADSARSLYNQARSLDAEVNRQSAQLESVVDNDLRVLGLYCDATLRRSAAWPSVLSYEPDVASLVSASLGASMLGTLLQGDPNASCDDESGYSVQEAYEAVRASNQGTAPSSTAAAGLIARAHELDGAETMLMTAGALLACVVAFLILMDIGREPGPEDVSRHPGALRSILAVAWPIALLTGAVLLAVSGVDRWLTIAIVAVAAVLCALGVVWAVRTQPAFHEGPGSPAARRLAEIFGAAVLVLFSAAALGYSYLAVQEREAAARADAATSFAHELQQTGRQEAMRDLSNVAMMARLDAEGVAAEQLAATDPSAGGGGRADVDARLSSLSAKLQRIEDDVRSETRTVTADRADASCGASADDAAPEPLTLYRKAQTDGSVVTDHLWALQEPARECDIVAALTRNEAQTWAALASTFTVSLVLLGLSAFILALAADRKHSRSSAWVLLCVGGTSAAIAVIMMGFALPDIVARLRIIPQEKVAEFAQELARGWQDPCGEADRIQGAIDAIGDYGPAYEARAYSRDCPAENGLGLLSSGYDIDLPAVISDLEQARRLGSGTPTLLGNLGWYRIQDGIRRGDDSEVRRGAADTRRAIARLESDDAPGDLSVHYFRFNLGLAALALGDEEGAQDAYADALRCLPADSGCRGGGGIVDDWRRFLVTMGSLADLELLGESRDVDAARLQLLAIEDDAPDVPQPDLALDVFPLELQLSTASDSDPAERVVWYARPAAGGTWALIPDVSWLTMYDGYYLNEPQGLSGLTSGYVFRADVYVGSERRVITNAGEPDGDLVQASSPVLGVSAAVPVSWTIETQTGVDWHIGPTEDSGLWLRRVEGSIPYGSMDTYLTDELRSSAAVLDDFPDPVPDDAGWLFGRENVAIEWSRDSVAGATMKAFGDDSACGGTLYTAVVGGADVDSQLAATVFGSLVLNRGSTTMPDLGSDISHEELFVTIPEEWDATLGASGVATSDLTAGSCTDGAYVDAWRISDTDPSTFDDDLDYQLELLTDEAHHVDAVEAAEVPGAERAAVIRYTWTSQSGDAYPMFQLFAATADTEWTLNFADFQGTNGAELEDVRASVTLSGPDG